MNKDGSGVRGEGGPETVNIAEVEISSAGDVIYVIGRRVCLSRMTPKLLTLGEGETGVSLIEMAKLLNLESVDLVPVRR